MVTEIAGQILINDKVDPRLVATAFDCTEQECWEYIEESNREINKQVEKRNTNAIRQSARDWSETIPEVFEIKRSILVERLKNAKTEEDKQQRLNHYKAFTGKTQQIPESLIEQAKQYPLKQLIKSRHNVALCPFHDDKTASLNIKNNYYHCHACGETGDTIKFLMKRDGLTFQEAISKLT